ncbi:MAG: tetratricopeptide repeat protein [Gammaproteobacteria bacterium]
MVKEAVDWALKSADQGHGLAQTLVGGYSLAGFHVNQDANEALRWFKLAANQGAAVGELGLGRLYLIGLNDFQPDPEKALVPLTAAYEAGMEIAAYDLGIMFRDGTGVKKDLDKAREYLKFAADRGIQGAQKDLANIAPALLRYDNQ